jgi:hypothetical protein
MLQGVFKINFPQRQEGEDQATKCLKLHHLQPRSVFWALVKKKTKSWYWTKKDRWFSMGGCTSIQAIVEMEMRKFFPSTFVHFPFLTSRDWHESVNVSSSTKQWKAKMKMHYFATETIRDLGNPTWMVMVINLTIVGMGGVKIARFWWVEYKEWRRWVAAKVFALLIKPSFQ